MNTGRNRWIVKTKLFADRYREARTCFGTAHFYPISRLHRDRLPLL